MLNIILIVITAIIVALLILAAFMEKKYSISSEIVINRPRQEVFEYVRHLKNQEKYSKWVMSDPNVQLEYKGVDGTVGFISSWKSEEKNVGVGEQEITKIIDGERYEVEIRFKKPFKAVNHAYTSVESLSDNQSRVTTVFNTSNPYPMNLMVPFIKKMLKKDLNENASNLKRVLENS